MDEDGDVDCTGPFEEKELIKQKYLFEQQFIREHRSLFSETISPDKYLHHPPMQIKLKLTDWTLLCTSSNPGAYQSL